MENLRSIEARNRLFNFTFDVVKWFKYKSVDVKNFWKRRKKKKFWKNEKDIASRLFLSDRPYTQTNAKSAWITFFGSNTTVILLKQKKRSGSWKCVLDDIPPFGGVDSSLFSFYRIHPLTKRRLYRNFWNRLHSEEETCLQPKGEACLGGSGIAGNVDQESVSSFGCGCRLLLGLRRQCAGGYVCQLCVVFGGVTCTNYTPPPTLLHTTKRNLAIMALARSNVLLSPRCVLVVCWYCLLNHM